ncbi:MAG: hypothetical protein ACI8RD_009763 [Bacillariaceae sp.]|jgi:hypothetical protein
MNPSNLLRETTINGLECIDLQQLAFFVVVFSVNDVWISISHTLSRGSYASNISKKGAENPLCCNARGQMLVRTTEKASKL